LAVVETPLEEGRTAPAETLALQLATAPLAYLEGALDNPALRPELLLIALKNRAVTTSLIQSICRRAAWLKLYDIKAALAMHAKTPRPVAMNLVQFLWWRDLARVADHAVLSPPLRRAAERLLSIRVQEMAVGEKVSLARIATRGVISVLRKQEDPMVIRALLQNPRLLEEDALAIAVASGTPGTVLKALAEDSRFSSRPALQKAIVQNRETPPSTALRIVQSLSTRVLKELARAPQVGQLVRVAAMRLIEAREGPE
jgi:hypothetical protein